MDTRQSVQALRERFYQCLTCIPHFLKRFEVR